MKRTTRFFSLILSLVIATTTAFPTTSWSAKKPAKSQSRGGEGNYHLQRYNPGPDPSTEMGRAFINLTADQVPDYPVMSEALMKEQKFRFIFGRMPLRTYYGPNSVKIIFMGQDATHIAEAAKQPGTSGFGGRVQDIGNYLGVDHSIATTNAFQSTIKGQYGAFDHVFVELDDKGVPHIRQSAYVDNELWLLANGADSQIRISRELMWEWMIKNNSDSLKFMLMFGGAARDAFAEFLIARGAKVGTRLDPERLKNIQVPETKLVYAGGNNEFPVPITKDGKDVYEVLLGRRLDYSKIGDQEAAVKALQESGQKGVDLMVFTQGGVDGSGVVNAAQLGGYDLENVMINGKQTFSLKGLKLSDGTVIKDDLIFTMSPHPSSLSKMTPEQAADAVSKAFARIEQYKDLLEPDLGTDGKPMVNRWAKGEKYKYARGDIGPGYFGIGAPADRRVARADASRLDPQTIIAGSRAKEKFDQRLLSAAKEGKPSKKMDPKDSWADHPRQKETRFVFSVPDEEAADIYLDTIDRDKLFALKPGMDSFEKNGIDAYYTKTNPATDIFGFPRGSFDKSRAFILADPQGIDEWITERDMTGTRGQYLNGLMEDLGFGEDYLVMRTAPVGMDGATAEEWEHVRKATVDYREAMIDKALKNKNLEVIFADGPVATEEMDRILKKMGRTDLQVINVKREGAKPESGIVDAGKEAKQKLKLSKAEIRGVMEDIPRSHLPFHSRAWEGTGGDTVVDALGKAKGGVRALVTPNWVAKQKFVPTALTVESIEKTQKAAEKAGVRMDSEDITDFLKRKDLGDGRFTIGIKSCNDVFADKKAKPAPAKPKKPRPRKAS